MCEKQPSGRNKLVLWHSLDLPELLSHLKADPTAGLTAEDATKRRDCVGFNLLSPPPRTPAWRRFLGQFENPLVIILLVAAVASAFAGRGTDAAVILAVTIVNAIIGFVQEMKAQGAIDALARMVKTEATVLRGPDRHERIDASLLVPGDVVLLATGDRVPADLRFLETKSLRINESALTGESLPVEKSVGRAETDASLGDRRGMGFSGSLVTAGSGRGIVVATGDATELGLINALINQSEELATPLMERLEIFSRAFGIWVVGFGVAIFALGVWRGGDATEMFMAAVSAAVGAIPEGLPAVMTIVLAIGVKNMAARQAIIRKLPAVETLGSVTVICSDKTGTLTANEMTVQRMITPNGSFSADGVGFNPALGKVYGADGVETNGDVHLDRLLLAGVLCNDSQLVYKTHGVEVDGDPTEGALLTAALKSGARLDEWRKTHPRLDVLPFDSASQLMASLNRNPDGTATLWVKGSAERLFPRCTTVELDGKAVPFSQDAFLAQIDELARQGMRILTLACAKIDGTAIPGELPPLTFLGLSAMIDPPRPEVRTSLELCGRAGIQVKMITGDHPATATAIGRDLGIGKAEIPCVNGREIGAASMPELTERAEHASIFARVAPEHKFRLVEALQSKGHIVAMTGDGVNDAPALKRAEIGVAMGKSGTEVAKEASDMLLVDDNFATLVRAVEEGRNVFNNLIKSMVYILPTNTGQGLVILAAILFGLRLPITPVQVLWVNLLTAFLSLPLAFEAMEKGLMDRPPRPAERPLLDWQLVLRIVLVSLLMTFVSFVIFWYERQVMGADLETARTAVVATMIGVELFFLFPSRGLYSPMPNVSPTLNPVLWPCLLATIGLQAAFTYVPVMQKIMGSRPIDLQAWLVILAAAATVIPMVEILKRQFPPAAHGESCRMKAPRSL